MSMARWRDNSTAATRDNFWTKDATKLCCPRCGSKVDAGASLRSMRLIARRQLACEQCGTQLRRVSRFYGSPYPVAVAALLTTGFNLSAPWYWIILALGLAASIWLTGKEIQSVRLTEREQER